MSFYESQSIIRYYKKVCNEIKAEALVIKNTDFNAVATFQNLSPKEAKILKFDQEYSIANTMTLKYFICHDEKNAMKGLKAEENIQWKIACYKAEKNLKKSVVKDLHKSYLANYWKAIKELFQIIGFIGIDDKCILSGNIVSEAFIQSYEKFIEICNQSILLFGFKSYAKIISDLNPAIKAINVIADKNTPELSSYKPKTDNKMISSESIQKLFDIVIIN
ncbi:hypothetical protein C1645_827280 [Glomus cerebriforme]|uniref:Uncharacterized protein n=1 Tax=Glomus cerebriforme TaxID=658196 RepID=A0A397SY08_9GLOM|nr:hypothetical protein C1645_827280 [Glomus cerebriforme]